MAGEEQRTDGAIYILLPVHNRRQVTERFAQCLARQTDRNFHLLLIDDGSTDGTAGAVRDAVGPTTVITGRGDWWWAGSLQRGYEWLQSRPRAGGEVVLIMNDDTRFDPEFLAAGRAALADRSRALLLARLHSGRTDEFVEAGVRVDWRKLRFDGTRDPSEVNCLSTRGLFLRLQDFLDLGGFHPRLLPHYGSDYEFTMRARQRGYRLCSDPAVRLWFDEATTGDRESLDWPLPEFLRRSLSKRHAANPVYWTALILLACPPAWIPLNLVRVWAAFLKRAWKSAARSIRPYRT